MFFRPVWTNVAQLYQKCGVLWLSTVRLVALFDVALRDLSTRSPSSSQPLRFSQTNFDTSQQRLRLGAATSIVHFF